MKSIKHIICCFAALALLVAGCAKTEMAQDTIDTYVGPIHFQDQTLTKASAEEMRRRARLQRASQLVCWAMPAVSAYQFLNLFQENLKTDPSEPVIGLFQGYDGVYVWLTANVTTPYTVSILDLAKTGPVVVEIPGGGVYGVANNAWQEPIKEINSGKAETLLFVGPGQDIPDNFEGEVIQSATFMMVYFYRVLGTGPEAEKLKTGVKAYRLKDKDNPPATKIIKYDPKPGDNVVINTPPEDM